MAKRSWFEEGDGIWQMESCWNEAGAEVELRRHMMCRVGDEIALAYTLGDHCAAKFGPRDVVENWADRTNRAALARDRHAHAAVSVVTFLACARTVAQAIQCWEHGDDVRPFIQLLTGADRLHH